MLRTAPTQHSEEWDPLPSPRGLAGGKKVSLSVGLDLESETSVLGLESCRRGLNSFQGGRPTFLLQVCPRGLWDASSV